MAKNILSNVSGAGSNGEGTLLLEKVQSVLLDISTLLDDIKEGKTVSVKNRMRQIAARTLSVEVADLLNALDMAGIARPMGGTIVHRETDPDNGAYTDLNN